MLDRSSKVFIAGHRGLVGSAVLRCLEERGFDQLLTCPHSDLDLTDQNATRDFFSSKKPEVVILAAAKVGGINANSTFPAEFIHTNLAIQTNVISEAYKINVQHLLFLGSSCIYPRDCPQPIKEEYLMTDVLEETNEPYAISKIAGVKMCEAYNRQYKTNYISIMPSNAYGPNDNYHSLNSHFFPALIKKAHECKIKNKKIFELWGTGKPLRELIYVDDVADACVYFMKKNTKETLINIGTGKDMRIRDYAKFLIKKLNLKVKIKYNKKKPDGVYRKVLDVKLAKKYGWKSKFTLDKGFEITYRDFLKNYKNK